MDSYFEKISLELNTESNNVRMVGICGIGGIGKTTIAGYVYDQISWGFECSSFLENVGEVYKNKGLLHLQNQLLNDILDGRNQKISNVRQGAYVIQNSLHSQKALIVFDDVDHIDQLELLEFLVGNHTWYGEGSRIIITTRDKHFLTNLQVDYVYEVEGLNFKEALKLFSQYAFLPNLSKEGYEKLLHHVTYYCQGLPLALKVLGSLLHGKTIREWESELHKLKKEPEVKIQNVLKRSFRGLDRTQKKIFLDIACFFKGEDKDLASKILDGCELFGERGIGVLRERCLITISRNRIYMHDLIQQMGWEIIREQHREDPSKWSRLWNVDDIYCAFISEKGMKNVETISLDLSGSQEIWSTTNIFVQMKKVFAKMKKLRLLKVYYSHGDKYKMLLPKGFEFPPNLKYLYWEGLESLPSNFHGESLVAINMKSSNIKELWEGDECFAELKFLDLSNSQQLIKIPKFSSMPKLETLNLKGCTSFCNLHAYMGAFHEMKFLRELNLSGIGIKELWEEDKCFAGLKFLDLSNSQQLLKIPKFSSMPKLETLNLKGCTSFCNLHLSVDAFHEMKFLRELNFSGTGIKELPSGIGYLESLESLKLSDCLDFEKFPEIQGNMKCLKNLYLDNTAIKELPDNIGSLEALQTLSVDGCSNLEKFPEIQRNMTNLRNLFVGKTAIKELPCSIGRLTRLERLDLENCKNLSGLPSSIFGLKYLEELSLNGCSNVEAFSEIMVDMEYLSGLYLSDMAITELPSSIERLKGLEILELTNCENLETLPNNIGNLTRLSNLLVRNCLKLRKLPENLRSLQCCLKALDLAGCNLMEGAIPNDLWCLSSLKFLDVSENHIRCIPAGIIQLSNLTELHMNHCPMLEEIPALPSSLRVIKAHGCPCLETLLSNPTNLFWLDLLNCFKSETQNRRCNGDEWFYPEIQIIIPGSSGIPEWIRDKSMGSEERIELPKNWYKDDGFLGFALFFHHLPLDDNDDNDDNDYIYKLGISFGDQSEVTFEFWWPNNCRTYDVGRIRDGEVIKRYDKDGTSDPALHVIYFPEITISSKYGPRQWNNFKARFEGSYQCGNNRAFKVKSYGIHPIYDNPQDHRQKRSSHDHPSEDHPHHKRSRHV
ncbi:disease resistance protein RPV1-like [Vitis riparia]|uniref:disease resistance protein RPV1-like n=1 Tax=Vitis riparia TaxID=96939 RepID=UPI00155A22F2|nr:disease resistance protein RPV1-like [Vitis riparia]